MKPKELHQVKGLSYQTLTDDIDLITLVKKSLQTARNKMEKSKIRGLITNSCSGDRRNEIKQEIESRKGAYISKH